MSTAYSQMVDVSVKTNMPDIRFKDDVYYYDKKFLDDFKPNIFGWILKESGTLILTKTEDKVIRDLNKYKIELSESFSKKKYYYFNGNKLVKTTYKRLMNLFT